MLKREASPDCRARSDSRKLLGLAGRYLRRLSEADVAWKDGDWIPVVSKTSTHSATPRTFEASGTAGKTSFY
jgi:hypothetical protein